MKSVHPSHRDAEGNYPTVNTSKNQITKAHFCRILTMVY